jgi:hypothetical protein
MVVYGAYGDQQFWGRSAKRDDGQADNNGRNTDAQAKVHGAFDQGVARQKQDHKTECRKKPRHSD